MDAAKTVPVFVYGTLISPKVCQAVLRRVPEGAEAILHGFARFSLRGRLYPAVRAEADSSVRGRVLNVYPSELKQLDYFESEEYERVLTEVSPLEGGGAIEAEVYIARPFIYNDMEGEWVFEHFEKNHLKAFLGDTEEFLEGGDVSD